MQKIKGTTIELTRGDTLRVKVDITNSDGSLYSPMFGDKIKFTVKDKYSSEVPVIQKEIPNHSLILTLNPEDTKHLPMPSSYVYDIELTHVDGTVDTFIAKARFKITEEVG